MFADQIIILPHGSWKHFETQAAAATDLGGIEISKNRLVITIGLASITFKDDAVAIITAAGEAKASIVKYSLENLPDVKYPATVLQRCENSRFYLTHGAAKLLRILKNIIGKTRIGMMQRNKEHFYDWRKEKISSEKNYLSMILNMIPIVKLFLGWGKVQRWRS